MSVWVYDAITHSHTQVEAESVQEYVDKLHMLYRDVRKDYRDCETFGAFQQDLCIFPKGGGQMVISVYEKASVGDVLSVAKEDVENVELLQGGLTDDGDYMLVLNRHNYRLPMADMVKLAVTTLALDRAIKALNKETEQCAKD